MKKKMLALVTLIIVIAVAAIGGTLAYFTDNETKTNTFTMGTVAIQLTESNWNEPDKVYPSMTYAKNPVVTNIGDDSAWIRMDVILSDAAAFTTAAAQYNITDLSTMFQELDTTNWTLAATTTDSQADTVTYTYYYLTELAKDASTTALFTAVKIPAQFDNADMATIGADFTITVQAHAMQTSVDYTTVQGAFAVYVPEN